MQAMDRAHRLGQRRSVAVYRLLVRGTLEERILGLQRFKLDVAGALVNQDNASLAGMDTSRLLDLFQVPPTCSPTVQDTFKVSFQIIRVYIVQSIL